jgi:hypothetical protein
VISGCYYVLDYRINYFSGPFASIHISSMHFSRRKNRQALHRSPRRHLEQPDLPLPLVRSTSLLLFTTHHGAQCTNRLLVEWHIMHVLDPGTKSCSYVHEWHCQERSWITGTTCAPTRGDLRAGGVDFPNGDEGDVTSSVAIGEEADVDAVERREATGNKVKPTRGGDLR